MEYRDGLPQDAIKSSVNVVATSDDSAVLVEVEPGIVAAFGNDSAGLASELGLEPIDAWLVPDLDRSQLSSALSVVGNAATVRGNIADAVTGLQGLYRVSAGTQALLNSGASLATKEGAHLGTILLPGGGLAQARFLAVSAASTAQLASAIGPALAMIALQVKLGEISRLVETNVGLTSQVLKDLWMSERSQHEGLVEAVDQAIEDARKRQAVTEGVWDEIRGSGKDLRTQQKNYGDRVQEHLTQIANCDASERAQYLRINAAKITVDISGLISSLRAWTGYQALRAGYYRRKGSEGAREADAISREADVRFTNALDAITDLIDAFVRELRLIAELPGGRNLSLTKRQKDSNQGRLTCAQLLAAVAPLADALRPPREPLDVPPVVCAPRSLESNTCLGVLRWLLEEGEMLRAIGFSYEPDAWAEFRSRVPGFDEKKRVAARDRAASKEFLAVTSRRILTARTRDFLQDGRLSQEIPLDRVRYLRVHPPTTAQSPARIELITRDIDFEWAFHPKVETKDIDALSATLAESMYIPDSEREELLLGHLQPSSDVQEIEAAIHPGQDESGTEVENRLRRKA